MEGQKTLTLDFVKSLMEPSYTLVWTDYNDNLDNQLDIIRQCLDGRTCECLWEKRRTNGMAMRNVKPFMGLWKS